MSNSSSFTQPGAPDMWSLSVISAMRSSVPAVVAVATKRPPGRNCRFDGSSPLYGCGRIDTTSNCSGPDRADGGMEAGCVGAGCVCDCAAAAPCDTSAANGSSKQLRKEKAVVLMP